jgi:hypothetical protein
MENPYINEDLSRFEGTHPLALTNNKRILFVGYFFSKFNAQGSTRKILTRTQSRTAASASFLLRKTGG